MNAIDETRKDFARVGWGGTEPPTHPLTPGVPRLIQLWFAGNHSDIGEILSGTGITLSDIALSWMCEQATSVPDGLITGPIYVDGVKMPNTGDSGPVLNIFPRADGVQHCEIAGMRDTLDAYAASLPRWLQNLVGTKNWEAEVREINHQAPVHATVRTRFDLPEVKQCAGVGPYRPDALAKHDDFKRYYPQSDAAAQPL